MKKILILLVSIATFVLGRSSGGRSSSSSSSGRSSSSHSGSSSYKGSTTTTTTTSTRPAGYSGGYGGGYGYGGGGSAAMTGAVVAGAVVTGAVVGGAIAHGYGYGGYGYGGHGGYSYVNQQYGEVIYVQERTSGWVIFMWIMISLCACFMIGTCIQQAMRKQAQQVGSDPFLAEPVIEEQTVTVVTTTHHNDHNDYEMQNRMHFDETKPLAPLVYMPQTTVGIPIGQVGEYCPPPASYDPHFAGTSQESGYPVLDRIQSPPMQHYPPPPNMQPYPPPPQMPPRNPYVDDVFPHPGVGVSMPYNPYDGQHQEQVQQTTTTTQQYHQTWNNQQTNNYQDDGFRKV